MASRRARVLIVDDEDNIVLAVHRVLYQDNQRYDTLLARTAEIAQKILIDAPVDVLVTDVHLPERSGMDLLCWAAVHSPQTRVIVMTAFDVTSIKDRAHAFGCLRLMRKPFDVHEMRAAILKAMDRRDAFGGNLSDLSTVDVLQMLCIARKSTALRLSEGKRAGVIHIENGELVHAVWEDLAGEDAFYRMVAVKSGIFYTSPLPPEVERTIKGDWQYLLIEAFRRLDEAARERPAQDDASAPSVPPFTDFTGLSVGRPSTVEGLSAPPATAPPDVARLIDEGFTALRSGRRDDARRAWQEALRIEPHNRMIELNLRKLDAAGAAPSR